MVLFLGQVRCQQGRATNERAEGSRLPAPQTGNILMNRYMTGQLPLAAEATVPLFSL